MKRTYKKQEIEEVKIALAVCSFCQVPAGVSKNPGGGCTSSSTSEV